VGRIELHLVSANSIPIYQCQYQYQHSPVQYCIVFLARYSTEVEYFA